MFLVSSTQMARFVVFQAYFFHFREAFVSTLRLLHVNDLTLVTLFTSAYFISTVFGMLKCAV